MFDIKELETIYPSFRQEGFDKKWLNFAALNQYLGKVNFEKSEIGKSFLGNSIYKLSFGNGSKRVLIWSQMHGNESSGTRAMFDVLNFLQTNHSVAETILNNITFDFIPMLNPDGANVNIRRNAVGIDINRDFLAQQSTEIHVLLNQIDKGDYEVLFNLHDQRTIFNVGQTKEPATLSFLAPSYNVEEDVNEVRQQTMGIIQAMNTELQKVIPGKVGRYTSEFYPMSTGDNFTKMGYPCVLFEAGHYPNDYQRNETRKYNALAIISGLFALSTQTTFEFDQYEAIPQNGQKFLDVVLRNVKVVNHNQVSILDIGIYYDDVYDPLLNEVVEKGSVIEIGDLRKFFGHIDLDVQEAEYTGELNQFPQLNQKASFKVGDYKLVNGRFV